MRASSLGHIRLPQVIVDGALRQPHHRWLLPVTVVVGLLSIGQTAAKEAEGTAPAQASPAVNRGKDGKVCQYEDVTGSRMKKRVCYTPEQWDARERAAKNAVREMDARNVAGEHNGT